MKELVSIFALVTREDVWVGAHGDVGVAGGDGPTPLLLLALVLLLLLELLVGRRQVPGSKGLHRPVESAKWTMVLWCFSPFSSFRRHLLSLLFIFSSWGVLVPPPPPPLLIIWSGTHSLCASGSGWYLKCGRSP